MFWRNKKELKLALLESAVTGIRSRGVVPTKDTVVAIMAVVQALGVPVTAKEEGAAVVAQQTQEACAARNAVPVVQKETEEKVRELQQAITRTRSAGEVRVRLLNAKEANATDRAKEVEALISLL